jgi:hypothetical protein
MQETKDPTRFGNSRLETNFIVVGKYLSNPVAKK